MREDYNIYAEKEKLTILLEEEIDLLENFDEPDTDLLKLLNRIYNYIENSEPEIIAHWKDISEIVEGAVICSNCHFGVSRIYPRCPICGAKMETEVRK